MLPTPSTDLAPTSIGPPESRPKFSIFAPDPSFAEQCKRYGLDDLPPLARTQDVNSGTVRGEDGRTVLALFTQDCRSGANGTIQLPIIHHGNSGLESDFNVVRLESDDEGLIAGIDYEDYDVAGWAFSTLTQAAHLEMFNKKPFYDFIRSRLSQNRSSNTSGNPQAQNEFSDQEIVEFGDQIESIVPVVGHSIMPRRWRDLAKKENVRMSGVSAIDEVSDAPTDVVATNAETD